MQAPDGIGDLRGNDGSAPLLTTSESVNRHRNGSAWEFVKKSSSVPDKARIQLRNPLLEWVLTDIFTNSGADIQGELVRTIRYEPTFPIWLNIPLSKSSAFFKPLSICETLAVGMAIITP